MSASMTLYTRLLAFGQMRSISMQLHSPVSGVQILKKLIGGVQFSTTLSLGSMVATVNSMYINGKNKPMTIISRGVCDCRFSGLLPHRHISPEVVVFRSKKTKARGSKEFQRQAEEDDDGDDEGIDDRSYTIEDESDTQDPSGKEVTINIPSLRLDTILKAGIVTSRSKIEKIFYESRIRINGKRALKKSLMLEVGDEVDIVIGHNEKSNHYLDVSRVKVVAIRIPSEQESGKVSNMTVKLRRYKLVTIENYEDKWDRITSDAD